MEDYFPDVRKTITMPKKV